MLHITSELIDVLEYGVNGRMDISQCCAALKGKIDVSIYFLQTFIFHFILLFVLNFKEMSNQ